MYQALAGKLLLALAIIAGPATVSAQDAAPIIAERPGFSSSPIVLLPSTMQIESGYQYTHDSGTAGLDVHTLPLMLVRVGLVESLELQLGWPGVSWRESNSQDTHGDHDVNIGVKWQVNERDATVPLALFAGLSVPTGDNQFGGDGIDPTIGAFWSFNAGMDWFGTVVLRHADDEFLLGNAVGVSLPISVKTNAYVEYFGIYGAQGGPENFLNGGFAYLPRFDVQVDVHVGAGLNSSAADLFLGFGVAYRF